MEIKAGGYRKVVGRRCQYFGVLGKTLVAAIRRASVAVDRVFHKAMEGSRAWDRIGGNAFQAYMQ